MTVYGKGDQTRSFCFVTDLVEGIYRMMISSTNEPINLGNPDEHTIKEFADIIKKLTKTKSKIVYEKLPVDDPHVRCPDIALAKKILKWEPKVSLKSGIQQTVDWFRVSRT